MTRFVGRAWGTRLKAGSPRRPLRGLLYLIIIIYYAVLAYGLLILFERGDDIEEDGF